MPETIALSLVSHTNVGKTTLARTLLERDVGEVRDAPHVTEFADGHERLRSPEGDRLVLWDTPGFGDSARLVRRLRGTTHPVARFLAEVWDRWRDRPFWASQQALRHVKDRSDLVLYLVNAGEPPAAAGYVDAEMELLAWMERPVLVLLNQLGPPRAAADEAADVERWTQHLARWPLVRAVLPLDAFARCWVQEGALWRAAAQALDGPRQAAMERLHAAWQAERQAVFASAMQALAASLARLASLRVPIEDTAAGGALRRLGAAVSAAVNGGAAAPTPAESAAERALAARLDDEVRGSTATLLRLHGLAGEASGLVLQRVAGLVAARSRVDTGQAAWWGGLVSGALGGLAADVAAGGLTLGGGLIAGGLLGALGAAGAAQGINRVRGTDRSWACYGDAALPALVQAALLRYLAVAHVGRGRGEWQDAEAPPHWVDTVDAVLAGQAQAYAALWRGRSRKADNPGEAEALAQALEPLLADSARAVLARLYPGA